MPTLIDQELYPQTNDFESANRPHTLSVLVVLMFAAITISYVFAYGASGALVSANILPPWPAYDDPRPRWMVTSFVLLLGSFTLITMFFRMLGRVSMRRIDSIVDEL
jgi:hypothetical protein